MGTNIYEKDTDRKNIERNSDKIKKQRYGVLDSIRGLVLVSMVLFHACWDLVYIFGADLDWYHGTGAYLWQQSICWTFIFLSGFCWPLGKSPVKRGVTVFLAGALVSLVTILFMPEDRVVFGVLTLIGSCMVLMVLLDKVLYRLPSGLGFFLSALCFFLTRNVNDGHLGFEGWDLTELPRFLYQGMAMTFLGFPEPGFYSTDYFSLIPWVFLFLSGYFLFGFLGKRDNRQFLDKYFVRGIKPFDLLGRHSLLIYMIHQPALYGLFVAIGQMKIV